MKHWISCLNPHTGCFLQLRQFPATDFSPPRSQIVSSSDLKLAILAERTTQGDTFACWSKVHLCKKRRLNTKIGFAVTFDVVRWNWKTVLRLLENTLRLPLTIALHSAFCVRTRVAAG